MSIVDGLAGPAAKDQTNEARPTDAEALLRAARSQDAPAPAARKTMPEPKRERTPGYMHEGYFYYTP